MDNATIHPVHPDGFDPMQSSMAESQQRSDDTADFLNSWDERKVIGTDGNAYVVMARPGGDADTSSDLWSLEFSITPTTTKARLKNPGTVKSGIDLVDNEIVLKDLDEWVDVKSGEFMCLKLFYDDEEEEYAIEVVSEKDWEGYPMPYKLKKLPGGDLVVWDEYFFPLWYFFTINKEPDLKPDYTVRENAGVLKLVSPAHYEIATANKRVTKGEYAGRFISGPVFHASTRALTLS